MKILIKKSPTASFETIEINDTPLGKGGQGAVHNILTSQYSADYCIKIYIRDAEKMHKKIEYMVTHPPQNIRDTSFRICWPTALVYNTSKEFIGYMMPLAFPKGHDLTILSVYRSKPLAQIKRYKNKVEWHNKYELDTPEGIVNRVKMLCNVAIALHTIHSTGRYVLVDLKPENIDATGTGKVSIMDTDSIQISENGRILHPATAYTPDYFAPEGKDIQKRNNPYTLQCDYFAAAICFYQILTGTHPYSGTVLKSPYDNCTELADCIANGLFAFGEKQKYISLPKGFNLQQNFYNLPTSIQTLFKRAFASDPNNRPSMEEWGRTFHEIITGGVKVGASTIKRSTTSGIPIKITGVTFSDEDYDGNVIRSLGSKLYNDVTYLCPTVSYTVLNAVGKVEIYYKIIDPKGGVVTSSNTKGTLTLSSKGSYSHSLGGWGNKKKTAYENPGQYHIEFYYNGKCIYKTTFTIYDLSGKTTPAPAPKPKQTSTPTPTPKVAPQTSTSVPLTITKVGFKDLDQSGNVIRPEGSALYTDVQFLAPVVHFDVHRSIANGQIWIKTISPSGKILTSNGSSSGRYQSRIDLSKVDTNFYQTMVSWGNSDGTLYSEEGTYRVEFYYENTRIYSTSLYITRKGGSKTTKTRKSSGGGVWSKMNSVVTNIGEWFEDHIDNIGDPTVWTVIFGIIGGLGLLIGAISTGSVFWGIVVGAIGIGIGIYVVAFGGIIMGFFAGLFARIVRYIFYNIYTLLAMIIIILGVIFSPQIVEIVDRISGGKSYNPTHVTTTNATTTYYCTAKDKLNIRQEPYNNATVLGVLSPGQSVQVYTIDDGWATIKFNGSKAYVSAKFISRSRP